MKWVVGGAITLVVAGFITFWLTAIAGAGFGLLAALGVGYNGGMLTYMWARHP